MANNRSSSNTTCNNSNKNDPDRDHQVLRVPPFRSSSPQTYTINTFLTHRWVVMLNGAEVKTWVIADRQKQQSFVLSKESLA